MKLEKVIIAGGRDYIPKKEDYYAIVNILRMVEAEEVVSGGAQGADKFGEEIARQYGLRIARFVPKWDTLGKAAGPLRNRDMAKYADAIILLPGGAGTESMRKEAKYQRIPILFERK